MKYGINNATVSFYEWYYENQTNTAPNSWRFEINDCDGEISNAHVNPFGHFPPWVWWAARVNTYSVVCFDVEYVKGNVQHVVRLVFDNNNVFFKLPNFVNSCVEFFFAFWLYCIELLLGFLGRFTKIFCFLYLWDSTTTHSHYKGQEWSTRDQYTPGQAIAFKRNLKTINLAILGAIRWHFF